MANTKPQRPNKFITFGTPTFERIQETAGNTGLTFSHIVDQFMRAHWQEMSELNKWLEGKEGDQRARAIHALEQYGPNDLITELQRIDPTYTAPEARQIVAGAAAGNEPFTADEVAALRALLASQEAVLTLNFDVDDALLNSLKGEA